MIEKDSIDQHNILTLLDNIKNEQIQFLTEENSLELAENSQTIITDNRNEYIILITMKIMNSLKFRDPKVCIQESLEKVVTLVKNQAENSSITGVT